MRKVSALILLAACFLVNTSNAKELTSGRAAENFTKGEKFENGSTFDGYPIYPGDGAWTIDSISNSVSGALGDAESVKFGRLLLKQQDPAGYWLASMFVTVNSSTVGGNQYYGGNPCGGQHVFVESKISAQNDNCLAIDAGSYKAGAESNTYLRISVTQTRSGGRVYALTLVLRPDAFGFKNTTPNQWQASEINDDPRRQEFMAKLRLLGQQLRDATEKAIAYDKPKDAFDKVPSFHSLMP